MRREGFYYWRGRPLPLLWCPVRGFVVRVPDHLRDAWRRDVARGRIKCPS